MERSKSLPQIQFVLPSAPEDDSVVRWVGLQANHVVSPENISVFEPGDRWWGVCLVPQSGANPGDKGCVSLFACPDCGYVHLVLEYFTDALGMMHFYFSCPKCGLGQASSLDYGKSLYYPFYVPIGTVTKWNHDARERWKAEEHHKFAVSFSFSTGWLRLPNACCVLCAGRGYVLENMPKGGAYQGDFYVCPCTQVGESLVALFERKGKGENGNVPLG